MRHKQRDCVKTGIGQLVREIILLAKKYSAFISIEKLSRFKARGRTFNRKVMPIPFYIFRRILEARCFDSRITLNRVDAFHTSKWCIHCGAVGNGHAGSNYSLFRCKECGLTMNSDRKASVAVAVKSFLERDGITNDASFQISRKRVPVGGLIRSVTNGTRPT
jgi:IS605 OrfB family transposase